MADGVVQRLVDELAALLGRSVEVDDREILPIAVSPQYGALDQIRVDAVLRRRSSPEVLAHVEMFDIRTAVAPVRYPADEGLGTLPRLCIPVRDEAGGHWGYLWLIDAEPPLRADEVTAAAEVAATIAAELRREAGATEVEMAVEHRLVDGLVAVGEFGRDDSRLRAVREQVAAESWLPAGEPLGVLAAQVAGRVDGAALTAELAVARTPGQALLGWSDGCVLLVGAASAIERRLRLVARSLDDAAARQGFRVVGTGLGPTSLSLEELPELYRRAVYAARVAAADPGRSLFARWSELGRDAVYYGLPWTTETVELLHPGAMRLVAGTGGAPLGDTVLVYLEAGGDSRIAAECLAVHRTTLYYRLGRARELLGHGWDADADRVGLHLALRLARFLGRL